MINEFEFFHGAFFARMLNKGRNFSVQSFPSKSNASYIINDNVGIYIKYSKKRLTPWRFSFLEEHQKEIREMKERLKDVLIILICNDDGIVALTHAELKQVLNEDYKQAEWVSVTRRKREMYLVKGSDGKLSCKVGESEYLQKIFGQELVQVSPIPDQEVSVQSV